MDDIIPAVRTFQRDVYPKYRDVFEKLSAGQSPRAANTGRLGGPEELPPAVDANVILQLDNLRAHPSVAEALSDARINLHGWVYDFVSGQIRAYDEQWKQFAAL